MITSPNITVKRVVNSKPMAPTVQKIVPRPSNLIRATNAAGKVVLIQKQSSTVAPVKLLNNAKTATATSTTTSYHLVKNESGVVMQPKGQTQTMIRRVVPATATSTTVALNKPKTVAARPTTHVVIHTKMGPSGTTTTKTLTVAEAHQMGLLNNNKTKQVMAVAKPRPTGISAAKSPVKILPSGASTNSTIVRLKQSPGAPATAGQVQRVSAVAKTGTQSHKVFLPHSAIQAGQQSGQIQAINIPGKGIQYVRFLNQSASSSSATTTSTGQKMVQVQMNKTGAAVPGSKIIVQNNKTYVVSNGNVSAVRTASGQPVNRVMTHGSQTVVRKVISAGSSQVR